MVPVMALETVPVTDGSSNLQKLFSMTSTKGVWQ